MKTRQATAQECDVLLSRVEHALALTAWLLGVEQLEESAGHNVSGHVRRIAQGWLDEVEELRDGLERVGRDPVAQRLAACLLHSSSDEDRRLVAGLVTTLMNPMDSREPKGTSLRSVLADGDSDGL